ncbi:hypothetical protein NL676_036087 [Syzygium grande]|nr:hypothetical protein NL676_036087 [Syzygium grande]
MYDSAFLFRWYGRFHPPPRDGSRIFPHFPSFRGIEPSYRWRRYGDEAYRCYRGWGGGCGPPGVVVLLIGERRVVGSSDFGPRASQEVRGVPTLRGAAGPRQADRELFLDFTNEVAPDTNPHQPMHAIGASPKPSPGDIYVRGPFGLFHEIASGSADGNPRRSDPRSRNH